MGVKAEQEVAMTSSEGAAHHVCSCVPMAAVDGAGDGRGSTSACACVGVEKVVQRSGRSARADLVKVGLFVALLLAVGFAIWR